MQLANKISAVTPKSDRITFVRRFDLTPTLVMIIQVYVPTSEPNDTEIKRFYHDLEEMKNNTKNNDIMFIIGDFNVKVGMDHNREMRDSG